MGRPAMKAGKKILNLFMKPLLLFIVLFSFSIKCFSQQFAVTDDGRRVKLNDDKTWAYVTDSTALIKDTSISGTYLRPAAATAIIKSAKTDFGVWYNPAKWAMETKVNFPAAENILRSKDLDGYCLVVAERISVPMENLPDVIKTSKKNISGVTNMSFEKEEYRIVNGVKVLYLKFYATAQGINFVYVGYFVSDDTGTYQVMCYTSKNLFAQYEKEFKDLMNGLVILKAKAAN